jgi:hypothetical protein
MKKRKPFFATKAKSQKDYEKPKNNHQKLKSNNEKQ